MIRNVSGPIGVRLRRAYYARRLRACGERLVIEPGVHILAPEWLSLGDDVWIDRHVVLIAGPPAPEAHVERRGGAGEEARAGEIRIGSQAHLGVGTIVQGHGGVMIGRAFTSSPHVKIYSLSDDHRQCREGTHPAARDKLRYLLTPVTIGDNVWLGMNSVVIGHRLGSNIFLKPGSVLSRDIEDNSLVEGIPARRVGDRFATSSSGPLTPSAASRTATEH